MFKKRLKMAWYWLARFGCQIFCAAVFRLRVQGRENIPRGGAYLLAGNHKSYLDPVFCGVGISAISTPAFLNFSVNAMS